MAKESSLMWPMLIIVAGAGIGGYIWMQRDKTPVGLVVTNAIEGGDTLGVNENGDSITMGAVEGTWRKDENSISVVSESAEKPLLVIYQDGTPIHAEVVSVSDFVWSEPEVCEGEGFESQECEDALTKMSNEWSQKFRDLAKEHGVTEESMNANFPISEESTSKEQSQAAESIYGPMLSLQSHFMW